MLEDMRYKNLRRLKLMKIIMRKTRLNIAILRKREKMADNLKTKNTKQ